MPSALEALCAAIVVYLLQSGMRQPGTAASTAAAQERAQAGSPARSFGTTCLEASATGTRTTTISWAQASQVAPVLLPRDDVAAELRPRVEHVERSKFLTPVLRVSAACAHRNTKHGCNSDWAWTRCQTCGAIEQVPKLEIGRMNEWNNVLIRSRTT